MRHVNLILIVTFFMSNVACVSQKQTTNMPFKISDASYYSWVVDKNDRGTTVEILVTNWDENVAFDSIIFRKVALPVRVVENNQKQKVITATLSSGSSQIPINTKYVDKPDQLIYHYDNRKGALPIKNIVRKNMVYY